MRHPTQNPVTCIQRPRSARHSTDDTRHILRYLDLYLIYREYAVSCISIDHITYKTARFEFRDTFTAYRSWGESAELLADSDTETTVDAVPQKKAKSEKAGHAVDSSSVL